VIRREVDVKLVNARRVGAVVTLTAGLMVIGAAPALADPAGPTNYESTVLLVDPGTTVAAFEVVGGDAFLEVRVAPGHTVEVPGYFNEPYIRVDADGTVWLNDRARSRYLNEDRYGTSGAPEDVATDAAPEWERVASGGIYAWHDHRVHWMSRDVPPAVAGETRQLVFPWRLPVIIDGTETTVSGELFWIPSKSPIAPLLAGLIALLPLTMRRRARLQGLAFLAAAAASLAAVIIVAQTNGTPPSARGVPVWLLFPAVALVATTWSVTRGRLRSLSPMHLLLISGVSLAMWAFSTHEVLTMPILPSAIPAVLERAGVAFVAWAGAGIAVTAALEVVRRARASATSPA
jgi:hypothetical protein